MFRKDHAVFVAGRWCWIPTVFWRMGPLGIIWQCCLPAADVVTIQIHVDVLSAPNSSRALITQVNRGTFKLPFGVVKGGSKSRSSILK